MDSEQNEIIKLASDMECTGCMACKNICSRNAIETVHNKKGFYRPVINMDKCVKCNRCSTVCPKLNPLDVHITNQKYYAFKNTKEVRLQSSSGGVFTWISDYILSEHGIVAGCIVDKDMRIRHSITETAEGRNRMRGSKYVQSDVGLVYRAIKEGLDTGRKVLFTGTPCQCEALISYLGNHKSLQNLYTLDFICEGGASPFVYDDFIDYYRKRLNIEIMDIVFRDKNSVDYPDNIPLSRKLIVYKPNGIPVYSRRINDRFHDCLFLGALQQNACEKCRFHSYVHCTDITCGDFHRYSLNNEFKDEYGLSEIIVNTVKGKQLIDKYNENIQLVECTKRDVWQPLLENDASRWKLKDLFWSIYKKNGFAAATTLVLPHIIRVNYVRALKKIIKSMIIWKN